MNMVFRFCHIFNKTQPSITFTNINWVVRVRNSLSNLVILDISLLSDNHINIQEIVGWNTLNLIWLGKHTYTYTQGKKKEQHKYLTQFSENHVFVA